MPWFRIDDSFYDHPKVFDAPDCAVALWTRAGTWSARNLTDGFVPSGMPARLCDDSDTATRELLRRGLWLRTTGGFQFHDWHDFQPTADAVRTLREHRAAAGKLGGQAKAALAKAKQPSSKSQASASRVAKQNAAPTRPDPTKVKNSSSPATPATDRPPSRTGSDDDPDFVKFWATYPRRIGKGQARKAWSKAIKDGADPATIIEAASRFAATRGHEDPKFIPHPTTWLNGERWADAPDPTPIQAGPVMPWELWDS